MRPGRSPAIFRGAAALFARRHSSCSSAPSNSTGGGGASSSSTKKRRFAALWGNGDYGRLGHGVPESRWTPTPCRVSPDGDDDPPVSLACGGAHTLFLTESGRVFACGLNNYGQLGISPSTEYTLEPIETTGFLEKVVEISAGHYHSCAITENGKLYVWGSNSNGQLGLGKKAGKAVCTPRIVEFLGDAFVKMASLGAEHSIVVTGEGHVLSWGSGGDGKLGHGHQSNLLGFTRITSEYTPRLIRNLEGVVVKRIAAGLTHSACIDENGTVFVFGNNMNEEMGFGMFNSTSKPSAVQELPFSIEVACGGHHTCVITNEGELYTWGSNQNGCLGHVTEMGHTPQHVKIPPLRLPVSKVCCGWKHTAAISDGNVYTWGWGGASGTFFDESQSSGGQLGHGSDVDYVVPTLLKIGKDVRALHVSCGFNHTGGIFECDY